MVACSPTNSIRLDVVGHQAIGPNFDRLLAAALGEQVAIKRVVGWLEEDLLAPVAALRHVMESPE